MKIRRFISKRRRRAGNRLVAAMCGIHLSREEQQMVLVHRGLRPNGRRFAPARPWRELPASLYAKVLDHCPPHDLELVGQRGPEVGVWRCRKCGVELS